MESKVYVKLVENSHIVSLIIMDNDVQLRAMQRSRSGDFPWL